MSINKNKCEFQVGDSRLNSQGLKMTIIKYYGHGLIDVKFDDGYIREKAHMSEFKNRTIRNRMIPAIYGVGILGDSTTKINGKFTKEYASWTHILQRCYDEKKQEEFPHYKGCYMCDKWLYFPTFSEWCHKQDNWKLVVNNPKNFHIDKDILVKGNKVYSPQTCSFVPALVNTLFTKGNAIRGEYPLGVSVSDGKFRARYNDPLQKKTINKYGFNTPEEAFAYYKQHKEGVIKRVAEEEYAKGTITKDCYEAMINYEIEITD